MLFSIYPLWATQVDDLCCALCLLQRRRELLLRSASCERRKRWASVENMPIILIFTYMRLQRSYCIVRHSRSRRRRPSTTIRYEINAVIDYSTYLLLRSYCAVRTRSPTVCTPTVPCPGALAERPLVSPQRQQQSDHHGTHQGSSFSFIQPYLSPWTRLCRSRDSDNGNRQHNRRGNTHVSQTS